jgi:energy-coupling factor transporter ATP-binding protein EcfA2
MLTLMWISRIRVNGGFLAGLDLQLSAGLNVVIGPRGVGKTTLLELIRHALGTEHPDESGSSSRQATVDKLLGSGEVILDLQGEFGSQHLVVDAAGRGRAPDLQSAALILGQNELERIASNADSRLNLIDLRAAVSAPAPDLTTASALTNRLAEIRDQIEELTDVVKRREVLLTDREECAEKEKLLLSEASAGLSEQRESLRSIEARTLGISGQLDASNNALIYLDNTIALQEQVRSEIDKLRNIDVGVVLASILDQRMPIIQSNSETLIHDLSTLRQSVLTSQQDLIERLGELRLEAEPIRASLESAESGLGQLTAQIRNFDAEIAQIDRAADQLTELKKQYEFIQEGRDSVLDEYETWQESVFEARKQIADSVSSDLQQRVTVSIQHLADSTNFKNAMDSLLQGSGLQFRSISQTISTRLLPRQLLSIVENSDSEKLATATAITLDRAARVVAHLQNRDTMTKLSEILLEDRVDFKLIDGSQEKSVQDLSTGQKCAVTLPIILTERARLLILDQPEDHLDNAYLVNNVVKSLASRSSSGAQTIVATHNANIPVLGAADTVVSMESDGVNGYVRQSGRFDHPQIVDVITSLMEGGREAFKRRAEFYNGYGETDG